MGVKGYVKPILIFLLGTVVGALLSPFLTPLANSFHNIVIPPQKSFVSAVVGYDNIAPPVYDILITNQNNLNVSLLSFEIVTSNPLATISIVNSTSYANVAYQFGPNTQGKMIGTISNMQGHQIRLIKVLLNPSSNITVNITNSNDPNIQICNAYVYGNFSTIANLTQAQIMNSYIINITDTANWHFASIVPNALIYFPKLGYRRFTDIAKNNNCNQTVTQQVAFPIP